jgi:hypothetical protein
MELLLKRIAKRDKYTIGRLYINDAYFCDTIEDKDRGLSDDMDLTKILYMKIPMQTAIPTGRYQVTLNVKSPRFSTKQYYKNICGGYMPRLLKVKGFEGILLHPGVNQDSSAGCIIVGKNTVVGAVTDSKKTWEALMTKHLMPASQRKEKIYITIK